jgi:hypothetical protein
MSSFIHLTFLPIAFRGIDQELARQPYQKYAMRILSQIKDWKNRYQVGDESPAPSSRSKSGNSRSPKGVKSHEQRCL